MNRNKIICGIAMFAAVGLALLLPDVVAKGRSQSSGSSNHDDSNSNKKKHDNKQNAGEGANHAVALQINSKEGADKVIASLKTLNAQDYRVQVYQNGKIVKTYGALPLSDVQMISKTANSSALTAAASGYPSGANRCRGTRRHSVSEADKAENVVVTTRAQATLEKMQTALQGVDKKAYDLKSVEMPEKKN